MELLWLWIVLGAAVLILLFVWATYNSLVRLSKRIDEAWADIGAQLKRRNDMLGNLVTTVKGYTKHEADILNKFSDARKAVAAAVESGNVRDAAESEVSFGKAIQGMRMISEAYPDLKANQNFMHLQEEIVDTEDKIQAARRFYNGGVREYNIKITIFPNNLFASILKFGARELWDTADHAELDKGLDKSATEIKF
ncbi:MAG: LemA family protein [Candidatus Nomurabacteria bacterium]|jgi:LemA protein|nr:LemA family protein [Candidatus Nomurabacteria bacterium]